MKNYLSTIFRQAGTFCLLAMLSAGCLTACSDDDEDVLLTPLSAPIGDADAATVSSLTFSWDKVSNAVQYAYELKNPVGTVIEGDVTTATTATFTGLLANTTYTLDVWAYASVSSDYSRSKVATLTGTTLPVVPLATPQPAANVDGGTVTVTWPSVPNAETYTYYYVSADGTATEPTTTTETSVRLSLSTGNYTFYVYADSEAEAYSASSEASVAFEVTRIESYRSTASVDYAGYYWDVDITAYADGGYTMFDWYGYGLDLEFTVDANGEVSFPGCYYDGYYWHLPYDEKDPTGYNDCIHAYDVAFTRQGNTCVLSFEDYYYGTVTFTWEAPGFSIDNLVGTYNETASGYDYSIWGWGTDDYSFSYNDNDWVTIEKIDNTTIQLNYFYWTDESLIGTVDADARTITFEPGQTFATYYTFAAETGENEPVIATIDDSGTITITVNGWGAWYDGWTWTEGTHTVLTKQN